MNTPDPIWKLAAPGNYGKGRTAQISQVTFHHVVGDAPAAIARFQTPGEEVSSTYVIGSNGLLYQCVDVNDTPYTDSNFASNSRSITIEHAGGIPSVPYTDAMYKTSTSLVAYLIEKYGIQSFKRHRDVSDSPTACPGALDVERIVNGAQALLKEKPMDEEDVNAFSDTVYYQLGAGASPEFMATFKGDKPSVAFAKWQTSGDYKRMAELVKDPSNKPVKTLDPGVYEVKG